MGHQDSTMAATYRQGIGDSRLKVVTDDVHAWLFAEGAKPQRNRRHLGDEQRNKASRNRFGVQLRNLISIVSYQSFVRWIREKVTGYTAKQTSGKPRRPRTCNEIRELVLKLAGATASD